MATTEEQAVEILAGLQEIIEEGGDPIETVGRIASIVAPEHQLLALIITANHEESSVGATVAFDHRYLTPALFDMARETLDTFISDMTVQQGEIDAAVKH